VRLFTGGRAPFGERISALLRAYSGRAFLTFINILENRSMNRTKFLVIAISVLAAVVLSAACGSSTTDSGAAKSFASGPAGNNLTATLASSDGSLRKGKQEFTLTFTDSSGKPVDVGSVALNYRMAAMGSMAEMNNGATFKKTDTPGVYRGSVDIEMAGEWQAQITYEGPAGKGAFSLPVRAK
jgi:hypothetical protein